jgi:hypothetical protein
MDPLNRIVKSAQQKYRPEYNLSTEDQIDQQRLAFLVGLVSFALPTFAIFAGVFLSTCFYQSISHFYYAQFWGSVFIGCLVFIGSYLLVWRGQSDGERLLANLAGPITWAIALLPTSEPGCTLPAWEGRIFADITRSDAGEIALVVPADTEAYFSLFPLAGPLHAIAALILFSVLAWFALVVFTREDPERDRTKDGTLTDVKRTRNQIYRICGWTIVVMVLAVVARIAYEAITGQTLDWWDPNRLTLWCEAVALYAFGISWMVKGRFWGYALTDQQATTPAT